MHVNIIGMGMGSRESLTVGALEALERSELVVGAHRLLEACAELPAREKLPLVSPHEIREALEERRNLVAEASILVSGDVGFFSLAPLLYSELAAFPTTVFPGVSSLGYLCSRLRMPWQDVHVLSVHGREANYAGEVRTRRAVFLLTGGSTRAEDVCRGLAEAGLGSVTVHVGENLSYPDERIVSGTAAELAEASFCDLSAMLVIGMLIRSTADYRIDPRRPQLKGSLLRKICAIGIPTAIQMGITAFSNIFVQSYINHFESSCMAGWAAYNKIDAFALLPLMSLSMAITTFMGQNLGAGKYDRAKKGPLICLGISFGIVLLILIPLMIFAPQLVSLFNKEEEVLRFGTLFIRMISPFYLLCTINQVLSGALRGAGDTKSSMFIMLGSFVVFRQIYLFIVYRLGGGIIPIALGYPAGWIMCSTILLLYYRSGAWMRKYRLSPV